MANWGVRVLLANWGRWSRSAMPGELPHMSTTEKARMGRGGSSDDREMPDDVAVVDKAVWKAPKEQRLVLIVYYAQAGHIMDKAYRMEISLKEFNQRREMGESFVAMNL